MFDLAVGGIAAFARFGSVLSQRKVAGDSLSGVADGLNKTFYTNYYPVLTSGSFTVMVGGSPVGGSADYNTGEITLSSAPTTQPTGTYTFTPFSSNQLLQFVISGFDEMEIRWTRQFKIVDSGGNTADENSANLFVADKKGNDPVVSDHMFSNSRIQIAFLMACVEYRYALSHLSESAISDFQFREGLRGMMVDKSMRPKNLLAALEPIDKRVDMALQRALEDTFPSGDHFGGYTPNPVTLDYAANFEWQTISKLQDNRLQLGFHIPYRPLTFYP